MEKGENSSPFLFMGKGRKVKCAVTGMEGYSSEFYHAPNKKWYKDKETYLAWKRNSEARKESIEYFFTVFLGYPLGEGVVFPTYLLRRLKEYESYYGYETLLQCMKENAADILKATCNKNFLSDTQKISYICAILNQRINETKKREKSQTTYLSTAYEPAEEVLDLETKHQEKDIRRWLDDD